MWGSVIAAMAGVAAHSSLTEGSVIEQRRQLDVMVEQLRPYRGKQFTARPSKCESCGSREFKQHHGQTVCAYCRSGA